MKRNKFSLSHYKLLSADMGELVPCGLTEVLPGDTVQQATSLLVRVSPMVAPVMHPFTSRFIIGTFLTALLWTISKTSLLEVRLEPTPPYGRLLAVALASLLGLWPIILVAQLVSPRCRSLLSRSADTD